MRKYLGAGIIWAFGVASAAAQMACHTVSGGADFEQMRYCVSSALAPQSGNDYGPDNLLDGQLTTAWCEDAQGQGIGQTLLIEITGGAVFDRLTLFNGYQKSAASYRKNSRPRDLRITTWDGVDMTVTLADRMGAQHILLPRPFAYAQVTLEILSVYPGSKWSDTCIGQLAPDFAAQRLTTQPPIRTEDGPPGFDRFPVAPD